MTPMSRPLAEWRFGAGRGLRHMVYVTVSTGIGGGVILDGKLMHGRLSLASEIGHMAITEAPILCNCGGFGCWEALASGTALGQRATAAGGLGRVTARDVSPASRKPETRPPSVSWPRRRATSASASLICSISTRRR